MMAMIKFIIKNGIIFSSLIAALFLTGCIDEITFETDRTDNQLVVEGSIHNGPGPYPLHLSITSKENTIPLPLSGASITLSDGNNKIENYTETEPGTYKLPGNIITGETGQSYSITIDLPDGRTYQSIPEILPSAIDSSEAFAEPGSFREPTESGRTIDARAVFVSASTGLPQTTEPYFLKWSVKSVYSFRENEPGFPLAPPPNTCYVHQKIEPQRISLFLSEESGTASNIQTDLALKRITNHEFFIRHHFSVIIASITEQRYNYWQQVDRIINQTGTVFDVPPATVKGNVMNINDENDVALGYFEAAAVDTAHTFVTRGDLAFNIFNPCPNFGPECNNCLLLENSTLERPEFFGL